MSHLNRPFTFPGQVWKDLVIDFLELACSLKPQEQEFLLQELQQQNIAAESIDVHPSFSINGRLIIICEEIPPVQECWLYFAKKQKIRRWAAQGRVLETTL